MRLQGTRKRRGRRLHRKTQRGGKERPPRPLVCQCANCTEPIQKGDTFCAYHNQNKCPIQSPLTGAEPAYQPETYNNDKAIRHSHNCFAYAMNVKDQKKIKECREQNNCRFHVPGKEKGHPNFSGQMGKTCSDVIGRTMSSIPKGYLINFATPCKRGFSKVAMVVDEENDLHYYRQDRNGFWSHKPGARSVTDKDAAGARIWDPQRASRFYPRESEGDTGLNYDSFCSYMCVPRDAPPQVAGTRRRNRR
jgi:hypothetical protein